MPSSSSSSSSAQAKNAAPRYFEAVGRRKTAAARVRIWPSARSSVVINGASLSDYFPVAGLRETVLEPLSAGAEQAAERGLTAGSKKKTERTLAVSARVAGGGISSQAEAIRLGIARALTLRDPELRGRLKRLGFLKRDPRAKERKKFGLKKARRAPQWSKR